MDSKGLKPLKVESIAYGSKRLIDTLEVTTTNSKFISLSSPVQTAALKTLQDITPLALAANTLKFVSPSIFHSKDRRKKYISCS
jgi:hypothetical protein